MTLDEAIKHCLEVAEENDLAAETYELLAENNHNAYEKLTAETNSSRCAECATEHRQLAEWLTDYKELKNSIGAAKFSNMKEALELIREYKAENIAQKKLIVEYKRLLKAAVEDIRYLINHAKRNGKACDRCKYGNEMYCYADDCSNDAKWQHEAEALALIGEDTNVPASADGTNVGHKSGGWISCKDRLPNHYEEVLVVSKLENIVYFAWYDADISMFMGHSHMWTTREVTHWMPLPKPPKE